MGSSTHNQLNKMYKKQGFIPSMESPCEKKNMHYKFLTKKPIFFSCKLQNKKVSGVIGWTIKIYSKHSSNKTKTNRKEKVVLREQKDLSPKMVPNIFSPTTHLTKISILTTRCLLEGKYEFRTHCHLDS